MGKKHAARLLELAKEVYPIEVMDYSDVVVYLQKIGDLSHSEISEFLVSHGVAIHQNDVFQILNQVRHSDHIAEIESAKVLGDKILEHRETNFGGLSAEELMKG
jgi:hypothetical protein